MRSATIAVAGLLALGLLGGCSTDNEGSMGSVGNAKAGCCSGDKASCSDKGAMGALSEKKSCSGEKASCAGSAPACTSKTN